MRNKQSDGFSLIELMVSVALFSVVMIVAIGSLLSLAAANRKAQALQLVMNNLNIALDGMVRSIRMGTNYHCGNVGTISEPRSCDNRETGDTILYFKEFNGGQWAYWYDPNTKSMMKSQDGGNTQFPLTAPEVEIEEAVFYVVGAESVDGVGTPDIVQPKVVIVMRGTAGGTDPKTRSTFSVQSTAVQRSIDIP
ncbi:MAG: prepilin-type N-terminal cleavage/methylation domain-containing protein [Parcubacteria group bacterium]|nr:prepilin-type N-terminal cleavage/methylation domain-containing protein [Parcubacteria group bacterium]